MVALRLALVLLASSGAGLASATPAYLQTFLKTYKASGKLAAADCSICHTQIPAHNAYGTGVNALLEQKATMALTGELLRSIETADSDRDGFSNGDEIRANTLPGSVNSHPSGSPKPVVKSVASVEEPSVKSSSFATLIPKHAFHPSIVHFPVALFLFGGVLDLVGLVRRRSEVRRAAIWNMTAGAIATALSIPTGFLAASLSGYRLEWGSAVVTHLLFALGATVLMTGLVAWRARREPSGPAYMALLLTALGLVGWAGHLGGTLVYGG